MSTAEKFSTTSQLSDQQIGALNVFIGAILISFSAVFVKLSSAGPSVDGFYRMFFGGMTLLGFALFHGVSFHFTRQHLLYASLAAFCLSSDLYCWHQSIKYIGPGLATVLGNLQVFLLAIVGVLIYREQVNWKYYLALPVAILGLYFLVGVNWSALTDSYRLGVYLGLMTAVFYMLAVVFLRKLQSLENAMAPLANITLVSLASLVYFTIIGLATHESFAINNTHDFMCLFCYGLFGQAFGWLLLTRGLASIPLSLAGFLILMQPSGSFLFDVVLFNRPTPTIQVIGLIITLIAIYLSTTGHSKVEGQADTE